MHPITSTLLHTFLSPLGVVVLGAIDSSILFAAPFALDFAVIAMTGAVKNGEGRFRAVTWIESDVAQAIGGGMALLVIGGAVWSIGRLITRR